MLYQQQKQADQWINVISATKRADLLQDFCDMELQQQESVLTPRKLGKARYETHKIQHKQQT